MNLKSKIIFAVLTVFIVIGFASCISFPSHPLINNKAVTKYENPDENSGIVFGFVSSESFKYKTGLIFKSESTLYTHIVGWDFIQINPELDAMFLFPKTVGDVTKPQLAYFATLPVGAKIHMFYWESRKYFDEKAGNITLLHNVGLQKTKNSLDFSVKKPGLNYFGAYKLQNINGFVPDDNKTELDALKMLRKEIRNKAWIALIDERIKELQK